MLLDLGQLGGDGVVVDGDQLPHLLVREVEISEVDLPLCGHESDRCLDGLALALAAAEHPLEDADVLAEARPDEGAVLVLAEPVDEEDLRQPRSLAPAGLEPVAE